MLVAIVVASSSPIAAVVLTERAERAERAARARSTRSSRDGRETPRARSDTAGETADRHYGHTATQQERGQTDTATQQERGQTDTATPHPDQSGLHPYNRTGLEPNRVRNPGPVSKLQLKQLIYIHEIN